MPTNPADYKAPANADEIMPTALGAAEQGAAAVGCKIKLFRNDTGEFLGYLGASGGNYAQIMKDNAPTIELYFKLSGYDRWLSVSDNAYAAWYLGNGAKGWARETDGRLKSNYNGQHLSVPTTDKITEQYVYSYDPAIQLKIEFEPA